MANIISDIAELLRSGLSIGEIKELAGIGKKEDKKEDTKEDKKVEDNSSEQETKTQEVENKSPEQEKNDPDYKKMYEDSQKNLEDIQRKLADAQASNRNVNQPGSEKKDAFTSFSDSFRDCL